MYNFIEKTSSNIAFTLCKSKDKSSEEFNVLKYGVFIVVHTSIAIISTLLIGILTNTLLEISIISLFAALIKRYSGGVHSTSPNRCIITGIIVSYVFVLTGKFIASLELEYFYIIGVISLVHSFIILYKKCPVPSKNKPIKKEETRNRLRKHAFFMYFICIVLFIISILQNTYTTLNYLVLYMILGLYMQTLSLTSMGSNFILFLDRVLKKLKI